MQFAPSVKPASFTYIVSDEVRMIVFNTWRMANKSKKKEKNDDQTY